MKITEIGEGGTLKKVYSGSVPVYKGPTSDFPYGAYKILGAAHIVFGVCIMVVGIVHATLSYDDRKYFLLSGSVSVWCPLFAIAVGILGVVCCRRRYWEIECMKTAFIVVSFLTMLSMAVLIVVTVLIDFYYYDIIDEKPAEIFDLLRRRFTGDEEKEGYLALMSLIVAFASCELIISLVSFCVGLCCSPIYEPDRGQGFQLVNRPKPVQQVQIMEKPQPQQLMIQAPQQTLQRPQIVQQPQQQFVLEPVQIMQNPAPAPSLMYMPSTMGPY